MIADPGFTTAAMTALWSNHARVSAMIDVEVALTQAHLDAGTISDADAVIAALTGWRGDATELVARGWTDGSAVIPLLADVRAQLSDMAQRALHLGATSQDIVDTALMLQCRDALDVLIEQAHTLIDVIDHHAKAAGSTTVVGRTLLQPAIDMRLGTRLTNWSASLRTAATDAQALRSQLAVQLGGPVGDGASIPHVAAVTTHMAITLGLADSPPWHLDRTRVRRVLDVASALANAAATIAWNLALLAQPEIGEVTVRAGGSSAMAHKRNPIDTAQARAAAQVAHAAFAGFITGPTHDLERSLGPWHAEQALVPLGTSAASAALAATITLARSAVFTATPTNHDEAPSNGAPMVAWELIGDPTKPAVVLLHSLGADRGMWAREAAWLAESYRVLLVDTRGHGQSFVPSESSTIADIGRNVLAAADAAGLDRFAVCGISLGGLTGLWLAVHHGERLTALIVANSGARIGSTRSWAERIANAHAQGMAALRPGVLDRWVGPDFVAHNDATFQQLGAQFEATSVDGYTSCCSVLAATDLRRVVASITVPTLIISGADDLPTPPTLSRSLHHQIENSEYVEIASARHLSNLDRPSDFDQAIRPFLSTHTAATTLQGQAHGDQTPVAPDSADDASG
jgi:3-oxoadipate enol-lactonase